MHSLNYLVVLCYGVQTNKLGEMKAEKAEVEVVQQHGSLFGLNMNPW